MLRRSHPPSRRTGADVLGGHDAVRSGWLPWLLALPVLAACVVVRTLLLDQEDGVGGPGRVVAPASSPARSPARPAVDDEATPKADGGARDAQHTVVRAGDWRARSAATGTRTPGTGLEVVAVAHSRTWAPPLTIADARRPAPDGASVNADTTTEP